MFEGELCPKSNMIHLLAPVYETPVAASHVEKELSFDDDTYETINDEAISKTSRASPELVYTQPDVQGWRARGAELAEKTVNFQEVHLYATIADIREEPKKISRKESCISLISDDNDERFGFSC